MNRIEELTLILKEASEAYYNTDTKIISDEEFDELEREYQKLTGEKYIGAEPDNSKGTINVSHKYNNLVGTLSKCKNIDEFKEWLYNALDKVNHKLIKKKDGCYYLPELYFTLKYDGNSIVIEYDSEGKVKVVLTRGKNGKGLDLTHVFKDYHRLEKLNDCGIKYEVVMLYKDFEELKEKEGIDYKNPRSIVAGKLGCDNAADYTDYFTLIPLWLKTDNENITRSKELELLNSEFGIEYTDLVGNWVGSSLRGEGDEEGIVRDVERYYNHIIEIRDSLPFMIDGIVIEFTDPEIREELGMNTGFPNWATAIKFPYMEHSSKVTKFDYTLGDTGRITPRVWFDKVYFNGAEQNKQSLQNYKRFKELNLSVGSDILVQYRHDCLTYIERLDTENNKKLDSIKEKEIIYCPECGCEAKVNDNETFLYCPNPNCSGKLIGRLQNYLTKMDIKGIKENMLIPLKEAGLVHSIEDLYTMDYSKIASIDRMGEKVASNIEKAIQSKVPYDYEILGSLGIENCSLATAKDIAKVYSLEELTDLYNDNDESKFIQILMGIEGIAEITAKYIYDGIENNADTINFLMERKYIVYKDSIKTSDKQEIIVFTGLRDKDLKDKLEQLGHKVTGSVSNKTTIVVAKDPNGSSSSIKKAKTLNIPIMTKEEFIEKMKL